MEIKLRNVRWQPLPAEVRQVWVGPDQRVWYLQGEVYAPASPDLTAVKARIELFPPPAPSKIKTPIS